MKLSDITPKLNREIADTAWKRCKEINDFSQKAFNRIFNEAITEKGFNPKSYHAYMRKYF